MHMCICHLFCAHEISCKSQHLDFLRNLAWGAEGGNIFFFLFLLVFLAECSKNMCQFYRCKKWKQAPIGSLDRKNHPYLPQLSNVPYLHINPFLKGASKN